MIGVLVRTIRGITPKTVIEISSYQTMKDTAGFNNLNVMFRINKAGYISINNLCAS